MTIHAYQRVEQIGDATLYLGDCRDVLPMLGKVDAVVTDPPYPGYDYDWPLTSIETLGFDWQRQLYFWPPKTPFPLEYSACHVWSKCNVCVGDLEPYELIYEVNGKSFGGVFRHAVINCDMNAVMNGDEYHKHPTQKPINLMLRIVSRTHGVVCDPFMGSGTTGVACMRLGRSFIGIEIHEPYFDIACRRIDEAQRQGRLFDQPRERAEQLTLLAG